MKKFRFSLVTMAFIIAIGTSAFKMPSSSANLKADANERWFTYTGGTGGENDRSNYADLGTMFDPENACPTGNDLCVIKVEAEQSGSTFSPDASALSQLQSSINSAESNGSNIPADGVYVKGE